MDQAFDGRIDVSFSDRKHFDDFCAAARLCFLTPRLHPVVIKWFTWVVIELSRVRIDEIREIANRFPGLTVEIRTEKFNYSWPFGIDS